MPLVCARLTQLTLHCTVWHIVLFAGAVLTGWRYATQDANVTLWAATATMGTSTVWYPVMLERPALPDDPVSVSPTMRIHRLDHRCSPLASRRQLLYKTFQWKDPTEILLDMELYMTRCPQGAIPFTHNHSGRTLPHTHTHNHDHDHNHDQARFKTMTALRTTTTRALTALACTRPTKPLLQVVIVVHTHPTTPLTSHHYFCSLQKMRLKALLSTCCAAGASHGRCPCHAWES